MEFNPNALPVLKKCPRCGETKPVDQFRPNKNSHDGRYAICADCLFKAYSDAQTGTHRNRHAEEETPETPTTDCGCDIQIRKDDADLLTSLGNLRPYDKKTIEHDSWVVVKNFIYNVLGIE